MPALLIRYPNLGLFSYVCTPYNVSRKLFHKASNVFFYCVVMKAILSREMEDIASIEDKLGRSLTTKEKDRIGVGNLRLYLEELLQKRYWCISQ